MTNIKTVHWLKTTRHPINAGVCSTDGTQHERNYPIAPAPMPESPIQLLTELLFGVVSGLPGPLYSINVVLGFYHIEIRKDRNNVAYK